VLPIPNSAVLLGDQCVEHVNANLCRTFKRVVRDKPVCTLLDVRAEAICWEQEGRPVTDRTRSYSVPSIYALQICTLSCQYNKLRLWVGLGLG